MSPIYKWILIATNILSTLRLDERLRLAVQPGNDWQPDTTWSKESSYTNRFLIHERICQTRCSEWQFTRKQGNQSMHLLVNELMISKESLNIWLLEAKHGTSDFSSMSGMAKNSARREMCGCLSSWTRGKRDVKHVAASSSLCSIAKWPRDACRMWSIQLSGMHSRTIKP